MVTQNHESLTSFRKISASTSRRFGVTVGLILVFLAVWPAIRHHQPIRVWLAAVGTVLCLCGIVIPRVLDPLNSLWFKLGLALARITNPIVMGVMFFGGMVPLGWLLRRLGHDLLRLRRGTDAETYWIERDATSASSLTKQF